MLVFFMLFYFVYEDIKTRAINEFNNEQLILAETASKGITSFFVDFQSSMTFLSQLDDLMDSTSKSKDLIANFYNNHKNIIEAVTRVNAHGIIEYTYPYNASVIGQDISYQDHVHKVITTHKPVISDVFQAIQGYRAIAMHVPIFKGKQYVGSLAMLISMDKLGKLYLEKTKVRGTGNVWLLSESGIEIYCPIPGHTGRSFIEITQNDSSARSFLAKIEKEKFGTAKSVHPVSAINGKSEFVRNYLVFYRAPLGNTYWTIVLSYLEKDIYAELAKLRNRLILIFAILFSIILYYFYSLTKVQAFLKEETKRKRTEKILLEKERKHRAILQTAIDGFVLLNLQGQLIEVNETYCHMSGYNEQELLQMKINQLEAVEKNDAIGKHIGKIIENWENRFESKHRRRDGSIFDVEVSVKHFEPENLLVLFIQDITDRKKAEKEIIDAKQKAEESDRLKTSFLQNMSHEIRTPLNAISGFSGILSNPDLPREKIDNFLKIIQNSSSQLLSIVSDILTISSLETNQEKISKDKVNLNQMMEDLILIFGEQAKAKKVSLKISSGRINLESEIYTDKTKLNQVLTNLIGNALKFTRYGSVEFGYSLEFEYIKSEGGQKTGELLFFVKDSGIGIKAELQDKIFERFRQANESISATYGGTGLGLSISKGFVELLGGTIWVNSEPGKGSTFYFTIPYVPVIENDTKVSSKQKI